MTYRLLCTLMLCIPLFLSAQEEELDRYDRPDIVEHLSNLLEQLYVFPDTGKSMSRLITDNLKAGEYNAYKDRDAFAERLTQDVRSISRDMHLLIYAGASDLDVYSEGVDEEYYIRQDQKENFGFKQLEILPGNIGYLRFDEFPEWRDATATVSARDHLYALYPGDNSRFERKLRRRP